MHKPSEPCQICIRGVKHRQMKLQLGPKMRKSCVTIVWWQILKLGRLKVKNRKIYKQKLRVRASPTITQKNTPKTPNMVGPLTPKNNSTPTTL